MPRPNPAVLDALPLAGAEWELQQAGIICRHPLHDVPESMFVRDGEPDPPAARCPGCGADRPLQPLRLVIID